MENEKLDVMQAEYEAGIKDAVANDGACIEIAINQLAELALGYELTDDPEFRKLRFAVALYIGQLKIDDQLGADECDRNECDCNDDNRQ